MEDYRQATEKAPLMAVSDRSAALPGIWRSDGLGAAWRGSRVTRRLLGDLSVVWTLLCLLYGTDDCLMSGSGFVRQRLSGRCQGEPRWKRSGDEHGSAGLHLPQGCGASLYSIETCLDRSITNQRP